MNKICISGDKQIQVLYPCKALGALTSNIVDVWGLGCPLRVLVWLFLPGAFSVWPFVPVLFVCLFACLFGGPGCVWCFVFPDSCAYDVIHHYEFLPSSWPPMLPRHQLVPLLVLSAWSGRSDRVDAGCTAFPPVSSAAGGECRSGGSIRVQLASHLLVGWSRRAVGASLDRAGVDQWSPWAHCRTLLA